MAWLGPGAGLCAPRDGHAQRTGPGSGSPNGSVKSRASSATPLGAYFTDTDFTQLAFERVDPIVDFDWHYAGPLPSGSSGVMRGVE